MAVPKIALVESTMISEELRAASDVKLREVLDQADPLILRGLVYHATGDDSVISVETTRLPGVFKDVPGIVDPKSLALVKDKAFELLQAYRDGLRTPPRDHDKARLLKSMSLIADATVPESEFDFWVEELAIDPNRRAHHWKAMPCKADLENFRVIVIGAGLGGLNASIQLKKAGFNFEVLDKNLNVGGTWYQNKYPGARVDLPSRLYSHTIAIDYHFDHNFAPREENERYVNWLADRHGLRDKIRFGVEVLSATWLEERSVWELRTRDRDGREETLIANAIISAVGFLDRPSIPEFSGLDRFEGLKFHTTNFDPQADLSDKRVSVIGTGASGLQMVPDLLPKVRHLTVFQRSPAWVLPIPGYRDPYPETVKWVQRNVPFYANWLRFSIGWTIGDHGRYSIWSVDPDWNEPNTLNKENFELRNKLIAYIEKKVGHRPDLMEKLIPHYPPLSKRYVVDNGWFDALLKDNIELVADDPIDHVTRNAIVTKSGKTVPTDAIIFATGFRANQYFWPMEIRGRGGVLLDDLWENGGARAFWGISVAGLPNFFCIYGPNTNPKNTGPVPYGEMQVRYILQCIGAMIENGWEAMDVRPDVYEEHNRIVDERNSTSIFLDKRQKSYYTNEFGRSAVACPWATIEYWRNIRKPDFDHYAIKRKGAC